MAKMAFGNSVYTYHIFVKWEIGFNVILLLCLGQSHELLKDVTCEEVWENDDLEGLGFELMECAANMGDQSAVVFVAQAYETGRFLGPMKLLLKY